DIETGRELAERLIDRECGGDLLIEGGGRVERAFPHLAAFAIAERAGSVTVDLRQEIRIDDAGNEAAVADAVDCELGLSTVDRNQRNAVLAGARQDVALAGEAHRRIAVAYIEFIVVALGELLIDG